LKNSGDESLLNGEEPAREGVFDQQLSFSTPYVEAPQLVHTILKRDGREAPFDRTKIAEAIFKAAQSIGGTDRARADSLAAAIAIYLMKTCAGQTPTVDQVHDAVEKVLIEMGHARTALAYVRYRDRRARVRQLRQGNAEGLYRDLREAQRVPGELGESEREPRSVRTSAETLAQWDRERIVAALTRETGLDPDAASLVAFEVEQQIRMANVQTLTAPLIREMVGAKLIEHGFEDHARRHMRLGVPVYDAERIICGPGPGEAPLDPAATDLALAESIKREFALQRVFSREAADAHLRGDIHIHGLGMVDRLHSSVQSLEYVKQFGGGVPGSRSTSRPPKYADTLLAQMVHMNDALQNHFVEAVGWDAVNVFFAPFLYGLDDKGMRQAAQMLIYEYAHRAASPSERVAPAEMAIYWNVPSYLAQAEAIGPGGERTGETYAGYEHTAQQFAWALLDVFREGAAGGVPFPAPVFLVHLSADSFGSPGLEAFLDHVAKTAAQRGMVHVLFDRHGAERGGPVTVWQPRHTAVQRITVNLPRLAFRAPNERDFYAELERISGVVARAHREKRVFIERLLAGRSLGPYSLLAVEREGQPYLDIERAAYLVSVAGLNECVQVLTGREMHEADASMALAGRIAEQMNRCFAQRSEEEDIDFRLAQTLEPAVLRRLALVDLREFPEKARNVVKTGLLTHDISYTAGAQLSAACGNSPIERVRMEGQLHEWFPIDAVSQVCMPDEQASKETVAGFIQKVCRQTLTHRIAFSEVQP
jgi:ribonucleoside-triphosphate reductase